MSKDRLFEEAAYAITTAAHTNPFDPEHESLPALVPWGPIRKMLIAYSKRFDERAVEQEYLVRSLQIRIQELKRRPTVAQAAETIRERDALKAKVKSLETKLEMARQDTHALIGTYEQEPGHMDRVIQAILDRPAHLNMVVPGPTEEAIVRAQRAHAAATPESRTIGEYNFEQAILEAVQSLAKRMDATEGDTFNILKALKKLEGRDGD